MGKSVISPRIEHQDGFTVLGIEHAANSDSDLGAFWGKFGLRLREFDGTFPEREAHGVMYDFDAERDGFTYLTGFEFDESAPVPSGWRTREIPSGMHAVFETTLDTVGDTMDDIHEVWLPGSRYDRRDAPEFEYYGAPFDAEDPTSTFTVHIPVSKP